MAGNRIIVIDPDNIHPVDELYAVISVDENGNEGIVAAPYGNLLMPLVTSNFEHLETFENLALAVEHVSTKKLVIKKFGSAEIIKEIY